VKLESAAAAVAALRELDRDRYFATLFLPARSRIAVQALYAANAEIAAIRERAREPAPGEIRLRWWADALEGQGRGEVRQSPLADALLDIIETYALPTAPLLRLIEARRFDLYQDPMPDLVSFEGYAGETVSVLYQMATMILGEGRPTEAGDAAGHLGVAQALVGHLRAFGYNAAQRRIFLPWSILAANGVREADVFGGRTSGGLEAALRQLRELAAEHLEEASAAITALPRGLRPAFVGRSLLRRQLRLVAGSSDPFALPPDLGDFRKLLLLARARWLHR
jgi:15-cis-phytoene synthase